MARLAIAIDEDWRDGDSALVVELDERTSQSVLKGRRDTILLYRFVADTFVMFLGQSRVAGFSVVEGKLIWRFEDLRRFSAPVVSDTELAVPRGRFMLNLSPERFIAIVGQGNAREGPTLAEAASPYRPDGAVPSTDIYLLVYDDVLRRWNYRCAITGRQFVSAPRPHPDLELVAIRSRSAGGPVHAANYLPMVTMAKEAWTRGTIAVGPDFDLLMAADGVPSELCEAVRRQKRLPVPADPALWPSKVHLAHHFAHRFGR